MKATTTQRFDNYSEEALQQVIDTSIGKPLTDGPGGKQTGVIVGAQRVGNTNAITFELEVWEMK